ncbi:hypothetical protein SAY87_018730 [Trapa incisa]|uniref:BZIP domain-containing protein n=1 Tax=Trapa incisa TaxID=236973 RepID=A0AAN7Q1J5_9MYRT|nr:hypothetical protein SAY87_018730 [Trapa incisa]
MMDWGRRIAASPTSSELVVLPDRMVKIDMAHLSDGGSGGGSIGEVSGRARKRAKNDSRPSLPELNLADSAPSCTDLPRDCNDLSLQRHKEDRPHSTIYRPKLEQCAESFDGSPVCTTDSVPIDEGRSRSRGNLSEAEKEAKRLRRVFANRESARRTIRRRQAFRKDLTRKAFELTEENEILKKGLETARREFQNLEKKNKHLKSEIRKALEHEAKTSHPKSSRTRELKNAWTEMPTSLLNFPFLLHSTPFAPCHSPSIVQSPTIIQPYQALPTLLSAPTDAAARACKSDQPHQETILSITGPRAPIYMPAYPWVFTLSNQKSQCESSRCCISEQDMHVSASSSRSAVTSGNCGPVLPFPVKPKEASGAVNKLLIIDLNEIPMESPEDQPDHYLEYCVEEGSPGGGITRHDSKTKVVDLPFPADNLSLPKKDG